MASILDYLSGGNTPQFGFQGPSPVPQSPTAIDPSTLSARIQQWLGASEPDQGGQAQDILSARLQTQSPNMSMLNAEPTTDDAGNAALASLNGGGYVSSQSVADKRMSDTMTKLALLGKIQGTGGGSSVFSQTMAAINADPSLANLTPMQKIRLAQNKVGTNLTMDANGNVSDMAGAAQGLGNLKAGEETGQKQVDLAYNPLIASGEAGARQQQELAYAQPIETAKQTAQMNIGQQTQLNKKVTAANATNDLINEARSALSQATGSVPGGGLAATKSFFGYSDPSTQANAQLKVIGGNLVSSMPRMEGPQSDKDVALYQEMAGRIASPYTPAGDKFAALQTIQDLNSKYIGLGSGPGTDLKMNSVSSIPSGAAEYLKQNPDLRDAFDQKYGAGASMSVLGK